MRERDASAPAMRNSRRAEHKSFGHAADMSSPRHASRRFYRLIYLASPHIRDSALSVELFTSAASIDIDAPPSASHSHSEAIMNIFTESAQVAECISRRIRHYRRRDCFAVVLARASAAPFPR